MTPRGTMRLQFHAGFPFDAAAALVPYLRDLGISHLYASPILKARAGSRHGYDVVDPKEINPELGGEEGLRHLVGELRRHELGLIVDIVPNHMAVGGGDNAWWLNVLENGPGSAGARFFDIDWESGAPELRGKLLVPFLGKPYGEALAAGEIRLGRDASTGKPAVRYFHHVFPLRSEDVAEVEREGEARFDPAAPAGRARLHDLLERQHYRLAWWRSASDVINWRRFFEINELAGLRVEDDAVFDAVHVTCFRLYREGLIDGFRIDHVDGLTDPAAYCRKLRARLRNLQAARPADAPPGPAYLVVEKILARDESLPANWQVDGTTGYDFMNEISAVQHDPAGQAPLARLWGEISGRPAAFEAEEDEARREILERSFGAQREAAAGALHALLGLDLATRDWSRKAVERVVTEILVHFRAYRSYAGEASVPLELALERARRTCWPAERPLLAVLTRHLRGETEAGNDLATRALARFRQLSAPVAAKAVEDTAFYRYGCLLSRADVGFDAGQFALDVPSFHQAMSRRQRSFPRAMLATATHDHKRGEDVRARLAVLSEVPGRWAEVLQTVLLAKGWRTATPDGSAPSAGDCAILMQTIVGAWPPNLEPDDREGCRAFTERLRDWQIKALREAKLATSWDAPDDVYENAATVFLKQLCEDDAPDGPLLRLYDFAQEIAAAGALNGLSQALLKLTVPGVPDIYQGTEFWDFSLVDPDNRRPVDWSARRAALNDAHSFAECLANWRDGVVKQKLVHAALSFRAEAPELFAAGDYRPLQVMGSKSDHVIAFLRTLAGEDRSVQAVLVIAPRWSAALLEDARQPLIRREAWDDTRIALPRRLTKASLANLLTGDVHVAGGKELALAELLGSVPLALLRTV